MTINSAQSKIEPTLKLKFLSHGTLECRDLEFTRRFYEEFLGFEVIQTSKISLWCRLGGRHIYVCVQCPGNGEMGLMNHNGIDVETEEEVDKCYELVRQHAEKWKLQKISKPTVLHGTYSFYFWDADFNAWEILSNLHPADTWMFERGDQQGMGHLKKSFPRPESTQRKNVEAASKSDQT